MHVCMRLHVPVMYLCMLPCDSPLCMRVFLYAYGLFDMDCHCISIYVDGHTWPKCMCRFACMVDQWFRAGGRKGELDLFITREVLRLLGHNHAHRLAQIRKQIRTCRYIQIHTCTQTYTCTYTCTHIITRTHPYTYTYTFTYIYTLFAWTCVCMCMFVYACTCVSVDACVFVFVSLRVPTLTCCLNIKPSVTILTTPLP